VGLARVRPGLIRSTRLAGGALLAAAVAQPVAAQSSDEVAVEPLEAVVVSASRVAQRSLQVPAAIQSVDAALIREAGPQLQLSEVLSRVPGITALDRQNQAQDLQLSIRGFGARASFGIRGVRLIVDGIPATMPDGQGQAGTLSLSVIERIEVLRGPYAVLHGNAAGGVVQAWTLDAPARAQWRFDAGAGAYGSTRFAGYAGGGAGDARLFVEGSRQATDGFREHGAARREQVNGKLQLALAEASRLTVVANAFEQPIAQDPLGLTREQMLANPRQADPAAIAQDTRKRVSQHQVGGVLTHRFDADASLAVRTYAGQRAVFQTLAIPPAAQASATSAGGVVDLDRDYGGIGLQMARTLRVAGLLLTTVFGVDHDRQAERRLGYVNAAGVPGALKRDELNRVANTDVYGLASLRLAGGWRLDAGARASTVRFRSDDRYIVAGNGDDSGAVSYRATSPVLGVSRALSDDVHAYASLGRGFETPTFAEIAYRSTSGALTGLNLGLLASRSTQAELGLKWRGAQGQRIDAAVFAIRTRDEIVVEASSGGRSTFRNAGSTLREGLEIAWTGRLSETLRARAALSWLAASFRDGRPAAGGLPAVAAGNRLPGTPERLFFGELVWRVAHADAAFAGASASAMPAGMHAALELRHRGRMMVDDANSDAAPAATLASLRLGWTHEREGWRLQALARIDNLTDRRHVGSVIVNEASRRYFEPAPGRQAWLGVSVSRAY